MAITAEESLYTVHQLAELSHSLTGRREIVEGRLRRLPPANFKHGVIGGRLFARLYNFVEAQGSGYVTTAETGFISSEEPLSLRAPRIAFVKKETVPEGDLLDQVARFIPADTYSALAVKVRQWIEAGVDIVWIVDPADSTVSVHRADQPVRVLGLGDTLTGDEVLPGFECPVSEIFAR